MSLKRPYIRLILITIIIIGLSLFLLKNTSSQKNTLSKEDTIPTIFVHGFKGSSRSFNTMLDRFENNYYWGKKTMVCRVSRNGHIFVSGHLPKNQKHPFIQVIFDNNRSSIQDTTNGLKGVMGLLKHRYHVHHLYAVGHSMGGLVLTNFIEQTNGQKTYPEIKKLITIGSPFKGIKRKSYYTNRNNIGPAVKDLRTNSIALNTLYERKNDFNPNIQVLAIAGVVLNPRLGDGVVSQDSALGIEEIVQPKHFQSKVIYDINATHSGLHEHQTVDRYIGEFLWGIRD